MPRWALPIVLVCVALAACAPSRHRAFAADEAALVAWWVEDRVHGVPRSVDELATVDASDELALVAGWLRGRTVAPGRVEPPRQPGARERRWPALRSAIETGGVVPLGDGLLAVDAGVTGPERATLQALVDAENDDRRAGDLVILSLAHAGDAATRRYLAEVRRARVEQDAVRRSPR